MEQSQPEAPWAVSTQWAVRTDPRTDLSQLDRLPGLVTRREFDFLDDVQFLWFNDATSAAAAGANLATLPGVSEAVALPARQQNPRFTPNDPLFANQWHLLNTGQGGGTPGEDVNVTAAWDSVKGVGSVIGVVDDGLQHTHPDLSANYLASASFDFNFNDPDPAPSSSDPHGTSVAGVAAGRGNNAVGVSGAAPEATLAGLRLIAAGTTDADEAEALSYQQDVIDIYTNSWGPFDDARRLEGPGPLTLAAMADSATNGRNGLGNIYTWAAGNGLGSGDDVNYDGYANSRYVIAVSAIDFDGVQSNYSEPGAPLLVAAYSNGNTLGITTTDLIGGSGYSIGNYTNSFGGTSSAAPLAAGVVALILEANPSLTARDLKHLLVNTAAQNDATDSDWSTNAAGHLINHKYGFGALDATAAVAAAPGWATAGPEQIYASGTINVTTAIPDNNTTGVTRTFTVPESLSIETIEVVFNATHTSRGQLEVILTSPSGTQSILAQRHADTGDHYNNWVFTTVRHWDEDSAGTWTLKVADRTAATTGTWNSWQINVYGTEAALPPQITDVTIGGSGSTHTTYAVPTGSGEQLRTIPVGGLDQVSIQFTRDVALSMADLAVTGVNIPNYTMGSFAYDNVSFIATWTLASPVSEGDQLTLTLPDTVLGGGLALDGGWTNPANLSDLSGSSFPSGDGLPGGSFAFRVNVLPGDANRDNAVSGADFTIWGDNFGTGTTFAQGDFNGDGTVTGADFTIWNDHFAIDFSTAPSILGRSRFGDRVAANTADRARPHVAPLTIAPRQPIDPQSEFAKSVRRTGFEPRATVRRARATDLVLADALFEVTPPLAD